MWLASLSARPMQGGACRSGSPGTIASDLDINYGGKAKLLVDRDRALRDVGISGVRPAPSGSYPEEQKAGVSHPGNADQISGCVFRGGESGAGAGRSVEGEKLWRPCTIPFRDETAMPLAAAAETPARHRVSELVERILWGQPLRRRRKLFHVTRQ